jgi:fatty acid desaturase
VLTSVFLFSIFSGAFSPYPWVNGLVGWTLHSFLLVPYFSWAFSHAKHHRRTNDLLDGETHVPNIPQEYGLDETGTRALSTEEVAKTMLLGPQPKTALSHYWFAHAKFYEFLGEDGFAILAIVERMYIGYQFYLLGVGSTGYLGNDGKPIEKGTFPDHFRPNSRLFPAKMYWKVLASDLGIALMLGALTYCSFTYGFNAVYFWYYGPYFWINSFLVLTTWLHHTDATVPQFDTDNWSWVKGSLAGTIDRPMDRVANYFSHNISSTHVVHHLFHEIPHYHAVEATKALREYLEPKGLYNYDPIKFEEAVWKVAKTCHFVKSRTDGVQYYQSFTNLWGNKAAKKLE